MGTIRSLFAAMLIFVFLGACAGCAERGPAFHRNYRLTKIGGTDFLLPPDFSPRAEHASETTVGLGKLGKNGGAEKPVECTIRSRWFSLHREPANDTWVARLPAPTAWQKADFVLPIHAEWNRYFAQIYKLETRGCISAEGYEKATNWIPQSMPAPALTVSFFRDSLDRRGFVTLRPGMRLFIERSIFRSAGAETVANYLGETKIYYSVVRQHAGEIGLKLHGIRRSKGLSPKAGEQFPDTRLARVFRRMHEIRLFYLTLYVPPKLQRNGLLVGVHNAESMLRISRRIEEDPEIPCRDIRSRSTTCASFVGMVSASVEMNVRVNGKWQYLPVGSKIQSVLTVPSPQKQAGAWKTLKIRRLFRGRYYDLDFRRGDPAIRLLALFPGDEISWARVSTSR